MNIKSLRLKKNISQETLADILGVNQTAVSQWEMGKSNPASNKLPKLAEVLQCSIDNLFEDGEEVQ